jgi:general secretion pathway protein L
VLDFDWPENLFLEHERTFHFSGPAVPGSFQSKVPIFSLHKQLYEKFQQILDAEAFGSFTIVPSALAYSVLTARGDSGHPASKHRFIGRLITPSRMEVHRFHENALVDSLLIGKDRNTPCFFKETLRCIQEEESDEDVNIRLLCTNGDCASPEDGAWDGSGLPLRKEPVEESVLSLWLKQLLRQETVSSFDTTLHLKPWKMPKAVYPLLGLVAIYALFAMQQLHRNTEMMETAKELKRQKVQLENQWKPIEQLRERIAQLQEDQKSLAQFDKEAYPVLPLLNHLSKVTPDDTWLNYFSLRDGKLTIRGESKSAIKYLSALSEVEGLENVQFASPVSRLPNSDKERLVINMQINPAKLRVALEQTEGEADPFEGSQAQGADNSTISRTGSRDTPAS